MEYREYFAGANTPYGFYSAFDNIINFDTASKIYCIKGGPGTGKSTLMKTVAKYLSGENIEKYRCSSDPDSLDAIILTDRNIGLIDGTAPHIVDPIYPGAMDEIINLGEFWDEDGLATNKDKIIWCSKKNKEAYYNCYSYLKSAQERWLVLNKILLKHSEYQPYQDLNSAVINPLKAYLKNIDENTMPINNRNLFITAITPLGMKSLIDSHLRRLEKIIVLNIPVGFSCEAILSRSVEVLNEAGFSCDIFYCSIFPKNKIEHIISYDGGVGIFTSNDYHKIDIDDDIDYINIDKYIEEKDDVEFYERTLENYRMDINEGISLLTRAKSWHDRLEEYYIPHMNYEKVSNLTKKIIESITD